MKKNTDILNKLNKPWLVAAWPGMGNVGAIAAGYLVQKLKMEPVAEMVATDHFDVPHVEVHNGVITPVRLPRSVFYKWTNPAGRDLFVFLGEAQPSAGGHSFSQALLDKAAEFGVDRVMTFASVATQLHPSKSPRVLGAATGESTSVELKEHEVAVLGEGQIGGMNGVLLGAGAERGLPGMCLMGEVPFFAVGVPNPKAARAVLSVFAVLAGIDVDLSELDRHAATVDEALVKLLERLKAEQAEGADGPPLPEEPEDEAERTENGGSSDEEPEATEEPQARKVRTAPGLDRAARGRVERLFGEAKADKAKVSGLKKELDRLGAFAEYEDRFLDLFRRAA